MKQFPNDEEAAKWAADLVVQKLEEGYAHTDDFDSAVHLLPAPVAPAVSLNEPIAKPVAEPTIDASAEAVIKPLIEPTTAVASTLLPVSDVPATSMAAASKNLSPSTDTNALESAAVSTLPVTTTTPTASVALVSSATPVAADLSANPITSATPYVPAPPGVSTISAPTDSLTRTDSNASTDSTDPVGTAHDVAAPAASALAATSAPVSASANAASTTSPIAHAVSLSITNGSAHPSDPATGASLSTATTAAAPSITPVTAATDAPAMPTSSIAPPTISVAPSVTSSATACACASIAVTPVTPVASVIALASTVAAVSPSVSVAPALIVVPVVPTPTPTPATSAAAPAPSATPATPATPATSATAATAATPATSPTAATPAISPTAATPATSATEAAPPAPSTEPVALATPVIPGALAPLVSAVTSTDPGTPGAPTTPAASIDPLAPGVPTAAAVPTVPTIPVAVAISTTPTASTDAVTPVALAAASTTAAPTTTTASISPAAPSTVIPAANETIISAAGAATEANPLQPPIAKKEEQTSTSVPTDRRRSGRKRAAPVPFIAGPARMSRASQSAQNASPPKRTKRSLKGAAAVNTAAPLGVIDPASNLSGSIYTRPVGRGRGVRNLVHDTMLVLVDVSKRHDKFIVLQLISVHSGQQTKQKPKGYVLYERWGRTGTSGQSLVIHYAVDQWKSATQKFESIFLQKTGLEWQRHADAPITGKYRCVKQNYTLKREMTQSLSPIWRYWVDDGVDEKVDGWYDYDAPGNQLVEQLYYEHQNNPWLSQRVVKSGVYTYIVRLDLMTQTNIAHPNRTERPIKRVFPVEGDAAGNEEPVTQNQSGMKEEDEKTEEKTEAASPSLSEMPPTSITANVLLMPSIKPNLSIMKAKPQHKVQAVPTAAVLDVQMKEASVGAGITTILKNENVVDPSITLPSIHVPVDALCPDASDCSVVEDRDVTMNQTNIMFGNNHNKYYRMQLLRGGKSAKYHLWTRWGRVGESRGTQTKLVGPFADQASGEKAFFKKFREKSGYSWHERDDHEAKPGKYEPILVDHSAKQEDVEMMENDGAKVAVKKEHLPSKLASETKELVELLFEEDMYIDALREFDIDVRRMPLGKLTVEQINKGVDVLKIIEEALKTASTPREDLDRMSSKFYTTLPHDFGRRKPPTIDNCNMLQRSYDMCNVLRDMQKATSLMNQAGKVKSENLELKEAHPVDAQYDSLNAGLQVVMRGTDEYDTVMAAFEQTKGVYGNSRLLNVWRVERPDEAKQFKNVEIDNHALLWHGSHIGCISAILSTGLRIMPNSGGRVGRGIYLASENGKSQQYTRPACRNRVGCMFLVEAALGQSFEIEDDDPSLVAAPAGFDSVLACGQQSPTDRKSLMLDGTEVGVPVSKPVPRPNRARSSFSQDEYLVYREAQVRLRYVISVKK